MRLYRVHLFSGDEESCGAKWYSSKREADAMAASWRRQEDGDTLPDAVVNRFEFKPDRHGILDLLNRVAAHPDNG